MMRSDTANTGADADFEQPATLGAWAWFDVPTMLAMLGLGVFALSLDVSGKPLHQVLSLLIVYAAGIALNLLDTRVRMYRRRKAPGFLRWRGTGHPVVLNFLLDTSFVAGIIVLAAADQDFLIVTMLWLTGFRLMAHVAGTQRQMPVILLTALLPLLPLLFLSLQYFYRPSA